MYVHICSPSPKQQVFQPLILEHQRVIRGQYVVNSMMGYRLDVSVRRIVYEAAKLSS